MPSLNHTALILLVSLSLTISCAGVSKTSQSLAVESPTPESVGGLDKQRSKTDFDGDRAMAHVRALVEIGPRPSGSAEIEKASQYIVRELKSYGLKTTVDEFLPNTPKGKVKMRNIIAEIPGESSDCIMIGSHYDSKFYREFRFDGANDSGSSTGALLELARVMAADVASGKFKPRFTYQLVFLDGEEAFCREWSECLNGNDNLYGSRHMVEKLRKDKRIDKTRAFILLDMIGDKNLNIQKEESSSSWLVEAIWSTARQLGYEKNFPNSSHFITDDHIPFLQAGIPAVDLIDFDYGDDEKDYWHTAEDTLDKLSPKSLKIVGDVLLLSLPLIEDQIRR